MPINSLGTLGKCAQGAIEPRDNQQEHLSEMKERVASGEMYRSVSGDVAHVCIDGRRCGASDSPNDFGVCSAGATISLMVADDLTIKRFFFDKTTTTNQALRATIEHLQKNDKMTGGHTDSSADAEKSGCGANDNMAVIYGVMTKCADKIRTIVEGSGLTVDDETHNQIIANARQRVDFSPSTELFASLRESGPVYTLLGDHNEVVMVINKRAGTTLDRRALADEYGDQYGAFNVDVWAFESSARAIAENPKDRQEIKAKVVALAYYNIAAVLALCGPSIEIVTVD